MKKNIGVLRKLKSDIDDFFKMTIDAGRKTKEVITENEEQGFITRIIPALTSSDYWHYHNKWTGNQRAAIIHIHESKKGLISEFVYTV